jgi:Tol biopolymer transport system component
MPVFSTLRAAAPSVLSVAMSTILVAACSTSASIDPAASPTADAASVRPASESAPSSPGPSSASSPMSSPPVAQVVIGDGEAWLAFQSLADEFDAGADADGITHDDTIFLIRTDGTGLHRLPPTDFVGSEIRPTWSPDGTRIAFLRAHLPDDDSELWTIDADGSSAEMLYDCTGSCNAIGEPDWANGGDAICFSRDSNVPSTGGPPLTFEIWCYELATRKAGPVLTREDGMTVEQARISPDGRHAVYVRYRDPEAEASDSAIFTADLGSAEERQLTDWGLHAAYPDWSVANRIAFNTFDLRLFPQTTDAVNIYTVAADGTDLRQLTRYGTRDTRAAQPRWTSDGAGIIFTLIDRVDTDPYGERHLAYVQADGDSLRLATTDAIVGTHPELRPRATP